MGVEKTVFYALAMGDKPTTKVPPEFKVTGHPGNQKFIGVRNGSDSTWSMVDETLVFSFRTHKVSAGDLGTRFFEEMIIEEGGNVNTFLAVYSDNNSDDSTTSDSTQVYYAVSGSQDYATATIKFETNSATGQKVRSVTLALDADDDKSFDLEAHKEYHEGAKEKVQKLTSARVAQWLLGKIVNDE